MGTRKLPGVALALALSASVAFVGVAEAGSALELASGATTVKGHIKGSESADYTLRAKKGQSLHGKITHGETAVYFDVVPPGGGEAIFFGARVGDEFTGALPADGEYTLHVHLAGRDAYNKAESDYSLAVELK